MCIYTEHWSQLGFRNTKLFHYLTSFNPMRLSRFYLHSICFSTTIERSFCRPLVCTTAFHIVHTITVCLINIYYTNIDTKWQHLINALNFKTLHFGNALQLYKMQKVKAENEKNQNQQKKERIAILRQFTVLFFSFLYFSFVCWIFIALHYCRLICRTILFIYLEFEFNFEMVIACDYCSSFCLFNIEKSCMKITVKFVCLLNLCIWKRNVGRNWKQRNNG